MDVNKIYEFLGENADMWESVLNEIKDGKKTFDNTNNFITFGPIKIMFKTA